ncbi:MAG: phytoene/squalene synthase family protein [Flammeovirgaceae bacterium]|nr:phytoene/squalene synthase family protein [Flammeovirgaceae bacterium]MDW8286610.1 phytoene/squalene synthase family protein [Flammeovirgaceae bacterium]
MLSLYEKTTFGCSKLITNEYSTSFSLGIKTLDKSLHEPIYAIYGFVRYADEIVDTFHEYDKPKLLAHFKEETYRAIKERISLNPVLHSFQKIVHQYNIPLHLIEAFLYSMEMDLYKNQYDEEKYKQYIYGSAEVVGLMCLCVFCEGDRSLYESLEESAKALGSAFQKVNFLRDMKSDYKERGRIYFPNVNFMQFDSNAKNLIEQDIQKDFEKAYEGIVRLPKKARAGVYLAYVYYLKLFQKIRKAPPKKVLSERIRVPDVSKLLLFIQTYFKMKLNVV